VIVGGGSGWGLAPARGHLICPCHIVYHSKVVCTVKFVKPRDQSQPPTRRGYDRFPNDRELAPNGGGAAHSPLGWRLAAWSHMTLSRGHAPYEGGLCPINIIKWVLY
jgi:hypothetical protein